MAWSSPGNDHQAQILHCACNLSTLQRNLPAKPGWPLAAQSAAPCVAASCRALVCATSCASQPAGSASLHVVSPPPASPAVANSPSDGSHGVSTEESVVGKKWVSKSKY